MSRTVIFGLNEFYHVYNRGTEKRTIFSGKADYERFLALLYLCNSEKNTHLNNYTGLNLAERLSLEKTGSLVNIGAYCLMPNHFHLVVQEKENNGISRFMQKVLTGYTMYFNKRHERNGVLFQGKFKAIHVKKDEYLKCLISYVHLNPVKIIDSSWKESGLKDRERAERFLERYAYSSYLDYCGEKRLEQKIINLAVLPKYSSSLGDFKTTIRAWMELDKDHSTEVRPRWPW